MNVFLRPASAENWQALIKLKVREEQKGFVGSNLYSIAESQFGYDYEGLWELFPFGIFEGDTPVGFLMYGCMFSYPKFQAFVFRLMVDEMFQGKGYGRSGMNEVLRLFQADERIRVVGISYKAENEVARKLYAKLGFVEPGEMIESETLALLNLR